MGPKAPPYYSEEKTALYKDIKKHMEYINACLDKIMGYDD